MKFLTGLIVGILLVAFVPAILIVTGIFSMSAMNKPSSLEEKIGNWAWITSAEKNAPKMKNPLGVDMALDQGMDHYKENCVICHAAPGVEASEISKGLNPPAPMLDIPLVQKRTDGELFWTVKNGIRLTGMPAFGPTHSDQEIWQIVQFVRHLPQITAKEQTELREASEEEHHHEKSEESEHEQKPHTHTRPDSHHH